MPKDLNLIYMPDGRVVTQAEQRVLGERAQEAAEARRADKDRALTTLAQLGEALRVLGN